MEELGALEDIIFIWVRRMNKARNLMVDTGVSRILYRGVLDSMRAKQA